MMWPLLAALVLHLVLIQPNHPAAIAWRGLLLFPLELPVILLALLAFGQSRFGRVFRVLLVACLSLMAVWKAADMAMFLALNRAFNPVSDLPLVVSFYHLLVGAVGPVFALLASVATVLMVIAVTLLLWWACTVWARLPRPMPVAAGAGVLTVIAGGVAVAEIRDTMRLQPLPFEVPGTAFTARLGVERFVTVNDTVEALRRFRAAAAEDEFAGQTGLFDLVEGDVFVIFVESYGRTSFDTDLYADQHLNTLRKAEARLGEVGLSMASSFLKAPTQGGQSWLSHASFANGLWVDNQTSYRAILGSGRQTLFHLAQAAGFHTAAVMPQITMDWPEVDTMGFDTVLAAADLGYKGLAFNWITMPDQFTYAAADRLLPQGDKRRFVQIATGSSHAPWVPVPELIAWDALGDGTIFDPIVEASDPPSVVWQDHDRVRDQYRDAVDYGLQAVFAYAERRAEDAPLFLIIGDHQAAGFVAQDDRPHVPLHVVGPERLVGLVADEGFSPGLIPSSQTMPRPMSEMRTYLLRALTSQRVAEVAK